MINPNPDNRSHKNFIRGIDPSTSPVHGAIPIPQMPGGAHGKSIGPSSLNLGQSPSLSPSSASIKGRISRLSPHIEEQGRLFDSARKLNEVTAQSPLRPTNPDAKNLKDVYITNFKSDSPPNVVFKPGSEAAVRGEICYGIGRLVDLNDELVPAKKGTASVISREDLNVDYKQMKTSDGKPVLVNFKKYTDINSDERASPPSGPMTKLEGWLKEYEAFEHAIDTSEEEDEEDTHFIIPHGYAYTPSAGNIIQIDGVAYKATPVSKENLSTLKLHLVNRKDEPKNPSLVERTFRLLYQSKEGSDDLDPIIVPSDLAMEIVSSADDYEDEFVFECMEQFYKASKEDGKTTFSIVLDEDTDDDLDSFDPFSYGQTASKKDDDKISVDDDDRIIVYDDQGQSFSVSDWRVHPVLKGSNNILYVERFGERYQVEAQEDGSFNVVGYKINGMVQAKVENVFEKSRGDKMALDLHSETPARLAFYSRIDKPAFMRAFIATVLLRPEDGKITQLDQSNVLFQVRASADGNMPEPDDVKAPLYPVLIDLDETFPVKNDVPTDGKKHQHPLRCGLMGFPQARDPLTGELKEEAIALMKNIVSNQASIEKYLQPLIKNKANNVSQDHIAATNEVIAKLDEFVKKNENKDWSLQQLFFAIFPGYEAQWKALIKKTSPEICASRIGAESLSTPK